jgi:hypothetical protein
MGGADTVVIVRTRGSRTVSTDGAAMVTGHRPQALR